MDELKQSILQASEGIILDMTEVSVKWATYCLRNLKDDVLVKGLDIARALSQFETTIKDL